MDNKKAESAKVVGWTCLGFSIVVLAVSFAMLIAKREGGMGLLVVGLGLLVVGVTTLGSAKKSEPRWPDRGLWTNGNEREPTVSGPGFFDPLSM
jgi:apolipoprotein N-acyltransferase